MKGTDRDRLTGAVIGKALAPQRRVLAFPTLFIASQ